MPIVHPIWRTKHLTTFGLREQGLGQARPKAEAALKVLKSMLSQSEYQRIVDECERGEREVRLDNGFVMMTLSPNRSA
jgi:hypothetical protein